jgi:hypothetical protein
MGMETAVPRRACNGSLLALRPGAAARIVVCDRLGERGLVAMRTPDKNRFLQALRHEESPELPLVEVDPDITVVNRILGRPFPHSLHAYELPPRDYVELNLRMGNDMVYFADIWRVGRREKTDAEGRIHYVDGLIKGPSDLGQIWFPDLDERRRHLEATLRALDGTGLGIVASNKSAPAVASAAVGLQDYLMLCVENPAFVHDLQHRLDEYSRREMEMLAEYPVDAVMIGVVVGMKSGLLCSPAMVEEFHAAYVREQMRRARAAGLPVCLHVDGNLRPLMPLLLELGAAAVHPVEPCEGDGSIEALKKDFGARIALWGNIDINGVLLRGTPEAVRRDTVEHMERLGPGGGYIVASSHDLHQQIPVENFFSMRDAVHAYRRAPSP